MDCRERLGTKPLEIGNYNSYNILDPDMKDVESDTDSAVNKIEIKE